MPFLASEGCFWPLTASTASEAKINYAYVTTQDICNTFIEVFFFLWDVRFGGQIVRFTVEHLWIINEIDFYMQSMSGFRFMLLKNKYI